MQGEAKVISVRELISSNRQDLNVTQPIKNVGKRSRRDEVNLSSAYLTPKHLMGYFSDNQLPDDKKLAWSKIPNPMCKEGKLDYISLFGEESKPDMNLVKIYAKKHHNVPGPEKYNTTPKWIYSGN